MPPPIAIGAMAALGAAVASFLVKLFAGFTEFQLKRLLIVVVAIGVLVGLTTAFMAALDALVASIALSLPASFSQGAGHFLPSNTSACISAIFSAHIIRFAYEWNVRVVMLKAKA